MPALMSLPLTNGETIMIEVQLTALDAAGRIVAFTMGMARNYAAAVAAARVGMRARIAASPALLAKVRSFAAEAV